MAVAADEPGVAVTSPYDNPGQISPDGTIAYAQLDVTDRPFEDVTELGKTISDEGDEIDEATPIEGLQVEWGGDLFGEFELPASEVYGVLAAVIILIIAFGSVLAMGLPIGIALFGLGFATAIVTMLSNPLSMPDFTTAMVAMIGLGVGIDYALFIVTRYREALRAGLSVEDSVGEAIDTSGRAVHLRRHHRRHRPARPHHHGPAVRVGRGHRFGGRRVHDGGRVADAPAVAARLGRHPHRQHHPGRPHRRRPRRRRRVFCGVASAPAS